jgi:hypothetical protein
VVINSVVINDLNVFRAAVRPEKAEPVLVVDADAVLADPIASQRFQTVARRNSQIFQPLGDLELPQFAAGHPLDGLEAGYGPTAREGFVSAHRNDRIMALR